MNLDNSAKQQPSPASPNDISHPAVVKASVVSLASPAAPSESALTSLATWEAVDLWQF